MAERRPKNLEYAIPQVLSPSESWKTVVGWSGMVSSCVSLLVNAAVWYGNVDELRTIIYLIAISVMTAVLGAILGVLAMRGKAAAIGIVAMLLAIGSIAVMSVLLIREVQSWHGKIPVSSA